MLDSKFWEKYFKVYDILNLVIPYQDLMNKLEEDLNLTSDDIVLDVGSGTGNLMIKIKNKCKEIIGIDYSKAGIRIHKMKDPTAKVVLHDITKKFPFPDNHFSKIVSNNTIYTLSKNQQITTLLELYRIIKPGGKIVISNVKKGYSPLKIYFTHIIENIKREGFSKTIFLMIKMIIPTLKMFYYNRKIKKSGLVDLYHFLTKEEQKELLKKAGFRDISETEYSYADQAIINSAYK